MQSQVNMKDSLAMVALSWLSGYEQKRYIVIWHETSVQTTPFPNLIKLRHKMADFDPMAYRLTFRLAWLNRLIRVRDPANVAGRAILCVENPEISSEASFRFPVSQKRQYSSRQKFEIGCDDDTSMSSPFWIEILIWNHSLFTNFPFIKLLNREGFNLSALISLYSSRHVTSNRYKSIVLLFMSLQWYLCLPC